MSMKSGRRPLQERSLNPLTTLKRLDTFPNNAQSNIESDEAIENIYSEYNTSSKGGNYGSTYSVPDSQIAGFN